MARPPDFQISKKLNFPAEGDLAKSGYDAIVLISAECPLSHF